MEILGVLKIMRFEIKYVSELNKGYVSYKIIDHDTPINFNEVEKYLNKYYGTYYNVRSILLSITLIEG